jgi:acyl-coenzyme A synthetase/AMP-(fatty) acid ligase
MSAVEIEDAILKHREVREAAAIGVPDPLRGQVVKAFVVTDRPSEHCSSWARCRRRRPRRSRSA